MESFAEALNRLKDAHDKEVLGLQSKLAELNAERCRDAQRIEELFAKNQQLREQQRLLKENLQVLENRLRAGLCDRCVVTQELARKKQLEMETSHLQGLQHLFLLTNEMKALKQENQALKAAMRRLCGLTARPKPTPQEASLDPPSPLLLPSPGDWKASPKKLPGGHREAEEEPPRMDAQEGKPVCGSPPGTKASPGTHLPEPRALDMSPHCISNQLHGTIATVRPGARTCPKEDHSYADLTSPPSPAREQSLLQPPSAAAATYEALKRSLQADHLCLLSHHLSLHLQTPSGPLVAITTPGDSQPQDLKAAGAEAWEEPTGVLGLPGTLAGMQDPRLEGALHLLLAQQQLRAQVGSARLQGPALPPQTPPSSPLGSDSRGPKNEGTLPRGRQLRPRGPGSPRKEAALQDCGPDKPLDLSDRGRSGQQFSRRPSPELLPGAGAHSPGALSSDLGGTRAPKLEQPPPPAALLHPLPGPQHSTPSLDGLEDEAGPRPAPYLQSPSTNAHPGSGNPRTTELADPAPCPWEPNQAGTQRTEPEELDESGTSDSELSVQVEAESSVPGEGPRCVCAQKQQRALSQKRKAACELEDRAREKPTQARKKPTGFPAAADVAGSPRDKEPSHPTSDWEET